jgi:CheY-like chemotaxis protein
MADPFLTSRQPTSAGPQATALVVDDEPMVRTLVCHTLRRAGFAVRACGSGGEALAQLAGVPPGVDVVVIDMTMPGLSGVETATRLRQTHPALPVVLTSGCTPDDVDPRVITAFIQKPYRPAELVALVRRVIAGDGAGPAPTTG